MENLKGLVLAYAALVIFPVIALAAEEQEDIGKQEYEENCAVCHGLIGKGDGPFAENLKQPVPSITTIKKRNDGNFPFLRIYRMIDGRIEVKAHGPRDMPVWGNEFMTEAVERQGYQRYVAARIVRGRIVSIITYIDQLQEK